MPTTSGAPHALKPPATVSTAISGLVMVRRMPSPPISSAPRSTPSVAVRLPSSRVVPGAVMSAVLVTVPARHGPWTSSAFIAALAFPTMAVVLTSELAVSDSTGQPVPGAGFISLMGLDDVRVMDEAAAMSSYSWISGALTDSEAVAKEIGVTPLASTLTSDAALPRATEMGSR